MKYLIEIFKNYKMIFELAKNDFRNKYAGSFLGKIWGFIQPVITILLYWFVFQVGLRSQNMSNYPFVLWLTAGLIPWFYFSDALMSVTSSLLEYNYLVKKVVFNVGILPPIKLVSSLLLNSFFYAVMIVLFVCSGFYPTIYMLQLLYYIICTTLLVLGIGYFTSAIVVFVRDVAQIVGIGLQIGMWMTPIMWDIGLMKDKFPWLVTILKLNPAYYIVQGVRDSMFGECFFWERPAWSIYFWCITLITLWGATVVFSKLKKHFADVL